jgi:hypothetical protein
VCGSWSLKNVLFVEAQRAVSYGDLSRSRRGYRGGFPLLGFNCFNRSCNDGIFEAKTGTEGEIDTDMKILYQSSKYSPDKITARYLRIDHTSDKVVIDETGKTKYTNYTYRTYELPEAEYPRYSKAIAEARALKGYFPNSVLFEED